MAGALALVVTFVSGRAHDGVLYVTTHVPGLALSCQLPNTRLNVCLPGGTAMHSFWKGVCDGPVSVLSANGGGGVCFHYPLIKQQT